VHERDSRSGPLDRLPSLRDVSERLTGERSAEVAQEDDEQGRFARELCETAAVLRARVLECVTRGVGKDHQSTVPVRALRGNLLRRCAAAA
jgi:hypothetical protein